MSVGQAATDEDDSAVPRLGEARFIRPSNRSEDGLRARILLLFNMLKPRWPSLVTDPGTEAFKDGLAATPIRVTEHVSKGDP
jgi:hypothetical protein